MLHSDEWKEKGRKHNLFCERIYSLYFYFLEDVKDSGTFQLFKGYYLIRASCKSQFIPTYNSVTLMIGVALPLSIFQFCHFEDVLSTAIRRIWTGGLNKWRKKEYNTLFLKTRI